MTREQLIAAVAPVLERAFPAGYFGAAQLVDALIALGLLKPEDKK